MAAPVVNGVDTTGAGVAGAAAGAGAGGGAGSGVVGLGADGTVAVLGTANPVRLDRLVVFCASTEEQHSTSNNGRNARMNLEASMIINPDVLGW
jgi:hypothetical protein